MGCIMLGFRFASFALPLLVTFVLVAAEQEALQSRVRALTRQLAADRLTDRDRAEQQLLELGPAALAVLPAGYAAFADNWRHKKRGKASPEVASACKQPRNHSQP